MFLIVACRISFVKLWYRIPAHRLLHRETFRVTRAQLCKILAEHGIQVQIQRSSGLGQVPCHIAQFPNQGFAIQRVPLRKMLFHNIDGFSGFTAKPHHAVDQNILLAQRRDQLAGNVVFLFQPAEEDEDAEETDVTILEIVGEEGEEELVPVEDDKLLDEVFDEFCRVMEEDDDADEAASLDTDYEQGCGCGCKNHDHKK